MFATAPHDFPACPAPFNMARYVLAAGTDVPQKTALEIVHDTSIERWSYANLIAAVRGTGAGLLALGLHTGDRVLLRLDNTVDFPLAYLGAIAAGLIPVPTSAQLTAEEISKLAADLAPALVIGAPNVAMPDHSAPVLTLPNLRAMRDLAPCEWAMGNPERLAYIIHTSGTSGQPRAVMHAHRAIWARRMMWDGWYGLRADDRLLHAGAFNWTYTLGTGLMDPWAIGATALIPAGTAPLHDILRTTRATIFAAAPGVYRQMLHQNTCMDLPDLRHGLSAGEKLPDVICDTWRSATGVDVFEAYGMSECSTFISAAPGHHAPNGAIGFVQPGRKVAVLSVDGAKITPNTPGILAVHRRDPGLFLGYLGADMETKSRFINDWFLTGDIASINSAGAVTYHGRNDDMMNAGGFRVSPLEVERVLNAHPKIVEAACAEVTIKAGTSVIAAFYTAPSPLSDAELLAYVADHLARYKQPRLFIHCNSLPRGANNKLLRHRLRNDFEASHDQA
jgi:acyl-coenzyme A synthetase/AMP-(fatty) acid ligase